MQLVISLIAGLLFGLGLIIGGMADPAKVQNFLDVFGEWDLSLAFVMIGAIGVTLPAFAFLKKQASPMFADGFQWPTKTDLDTKLIGGAVLFGAGWGLVGLCPGPAIVSVSLFALPTLIFVASMLTSMWVVKLMVK